MLQDQDKQKLDSIVSQMIANKESDSNIQMVVNDFKQKYTKSSTSNTPISPQTTQPAQKPALFSDLTTLYGGGENGIANRLKTDIQQGAQDIQSGNVLKGIAKAGLRTAGDVAGTVFAPVATSLNVATGGLMNGFFEDVQSKLENSQGATFSKDGLLPFLVDKVTNIPELQKFAMDHPNAGDDFGRALNLVFAKSEKGDINRAFTNPQAIVSEAKNQIFKTAQETPIAIKNKIQSTFQKTPEKIVAQRVEELNKIDGNYAQMRKASGFTEDNGLASRQRVASTDVLSNAVDDTGTIRTKGPDGAIEQYRALTLNEAENVVKNNLTKLGEKTNLNEVKVRMEGSVKNSGLEGSDLTVALKKIDSEIEGLKLRADENGNVPLSVLQDAKINTTNNINYFTPPEINTYRKSIARAYRETIEKNSSLNVKEINGELSKYLQDIAFLERLDGKKVQGGKLGKYFAQISGNIIGGATGGAVGGPVGAALGTVVGGEVAGRIKGSMLSKTLGGKANIPIEQSPIIKKAIDQSKSDVVSNLEDIYSNNVGNRNQQYIPTPTKSIKDTINQNKVNDNSNSNIAPINKTSNRTISNSIPPKKGIIQRAIDKYKSIPNKQGGFVNIGGKEFKSIPEATKKEMVQVIDYLRIGEKTKGIEDTISRLAQKYGINEDLSNAKIADIFEKLIEQTKTQ